MTTISELSMKAFRRFAVGCVGFFWCVKAPQHCDLASHGNTRAEPLVGSANSFREIPVAPSGMICPILGVGGVAKIVPSIVCAVAISVVNLIKRLVSSHQLPYHGMCVDGSSVTAKTEFDVALTGGCCRDSAGLSAAHLFVPRTSDDIRAALRRYKMPYRSFAPNENACFRVIVEALAQILLGWQTACGHWSLLQRDWWQGRRWPGRAGAARYVYTGAMEAASGRVS